MQIYHDKRYIAEHYYGPLPECWQGQSDHFVHFMMKQTPIIQILSAESGFLYRLLFMSNMGLGS